jgi:hypothetical protein
LNDHRVAISVPKIKKSSGVVTFQAYSRKEESGRSYEKLLLILTTVLLANWVQADPTPWPTQAEPTPALQPQLLGLRLTVYVPQPLRELRVDNPDPENIAVFRQWSGSGGGVGFVVMQTLFKPDSSVLKRDAKENLLRDGATMMQNVSKDSLVHSVPQDKGFYQTFSYKGLIEAGSKTAVMVTLIVANNDDSEWVIMSTCDLSESSALAGAFPVHYLFH